MTSFDHLETARLLREGAQQRREFISKVEESFSDLDTTMNFKVNSVLKDEFNRICNKSHSNSSREIKLFMLRVVKQGKF